MKVLIEVDEWYPVHVYERVNADKDYPPWDLRCIRDVPDEVIAQYDNAVKAFNKAESDLAAYLKKVDSNE